MRRLGRETQVGQAAGFGPAENLRSPADPQRHYLYRHVFDSGILRAAQDVQFRLRRADRELRDRVARVRPDQAAPAVQLDELRETVDLRRQRKLPEPRRATLEARLQRDRVEAEPC